MDWTNVGALNIRNGKVSLAGYETKYLGTIKYVDEMETYKYFGFLHPKRIEHTEIQRKLTLEFTWRLKNICQTKLFGKNMVKATNTFSISAPTYSLGVIR